MQPTTTLMNEHRLIEVMLGCLGAMAEQLTATDELDRRAANDAVWFLRTFADRCHHGKEESELFPLMEARNFSPGTGPTAVMRSEHAEGRDLLNHIERSIEGAAAGETAMVQSFVRNSRALVEHLHDHIQKEDHCLFPMAAQILTSEDLRTLEQRFSAVDTRDIGQEIIGKCHRMAGAMADRFGVPQAVLETEAGSP
jgi:hemerythrin-like domain-containing protein